MLERATEGDEEARKEQKRATELEARARYNRAKKDRRKRKKEGESAAEGNAYVKTEEPATNKKTRTAVGACDLAAPAAASVVTAGETDDIDSAYAGGMTSFSDGMPYATTAADALQGRQDDTIIGRTRRETLQETQYDDLVYPRTNPSQSSSRRSREPSRPRSSGYRRGDRP